MQKEAKARIKINNLLQNAGWRFLDDEKGKANIVLENNAKITRQTIDKFGNDFEKIKKGFIDFLLLDEKGFPFVVLEANSCLNLIKRRSVDRGSIEPFLTNLHKGSLVFESLLKEIYTSHTSSTLGTIFRDPFIQQDLKFKQASLGKIGQSLDDIVKHILPYFENTTSKELHNQWLNISIRLRNITSHSLLWPDVFDEKIYKKLYQQTLFSILWTIKEKYF